MSDDAPAVDHALRAGLALYTEDHVLAAHEPWERTWLTLADGTPDERLLHGLIQFVAAIHHAGEGNVSGATGLAASASEYLTDVPANHRDIDLDPVRDHLALLENDPVTTNLRVAPPAVEIDGTSIGFEDLEFDAAMLAAEALGETIDGVDPGIVEDAVRFAAEERGTGRTQYAGLLTAFLTEADRRGTVYARLEAHVERERQKEDDVDGLF